ncbi:MAG: Uma2 family endonuclease [Chloroflexi bacterium]|nr:Uma2 family endonuclease [Chloroflexota bacterium]
MVIESSPKVRLTPEEYLAREREAETKSEYFDGRVYAMAGATETHNLIVTNLVMNLGLQLKKRPCKVYPSDMRVRSRAYRSYTYPDVTVVCGKAEFEDDRRDTLLNPTVIIEVLSPSTAGYDLSRKFDHYRSLESLREYVLAAQEWMTVYQYVRQPDDRWLLTAYQGRRAVVKLESIDCELPLADIYDKVEGVEGDDIDRALSRLKEERAPYGA